MKKKLLFLLLSVLTLGAWAQSSPSVVVADDINTYSGSETYVFSKADGKIYVRNNANDYERYGIYEKVTSLKVAGETINEISYIATKSEDGTDNVPYLNTGYIPKANTRIVLDVEIENSTAKGWMAVFGARQGGWTSHAFVLFARAWDNQRGCYNRTGDEHAADSDIPRNQRMTINAFEKTCTFTLSGESTPALTITTNEGSTVEDCTNNLYLFETNTAGANGDNRDNSYIFMKLYGCKIYEGETLVKDFVPVYNSSTLKGGMKDLISGDVIYSSSSRDFAVSEDAIDTGVTVYEGKMVYNTSDNKVYKYNGSEFVLSGDGIRTLSSTISGDYQDMNNWVTNDGHMDIFRNKWTATANGYKIAPYVGTSGHEPLMIKVGTDIDADYNYSFTASWGAYNSWHDVEMHAYVCNFWNLGTIESGLSVTSSVLATQTFPFAGGTDVPFSLDFRADREEQTLLFQFGDVNDGNDTFWFEFDNLSVKKYVYPEAYPVLNPFGPQIEDLLPQVEAFDSSTTTDAIATLLDAASTTALASLANPDLAAQKEALEDLEEKFALAKAANVTNLRAVVAWIKAKGGDVSAQEDYLVNGTTNDVDNQKNTAINKYKLSLERSPQPTIFTKISESVVGTDDNEYGTIVEDHADGFYVYNVGTGRWFCGGDDWGAHAAVGFPGIKVTTPKNDYGSGHYNSIKTWLFNGNWGEGGLLNHGGYCDTGGNGWKFFKQNDAQGIYTWARNGSDTGDNGNNGYGTKNLVGFAPSSYALVNTDRAGADDPYNQWIFVTEAQRDEMAAAAMATASESSPVDLTYKIKMPGLNQRERKEGTNQNDDVLDWTCNHPNYCYNASDNGSRKIIMGRGDNHADFVCDIYGLDWNDSFSWTQTVTGLTPGKYRVKVQGYNDNGEAANKACLVANGQKAALVELSSESVLPWTSGLPANTFDNPEYFQTGLYWNEVICTVGSNGELTLGVESPNVTGSHVVIFDNFRLEYVGSASESVTVTSAGYATYCSENALDFTSTDIKAYVGTRSGDKLTFTPITQVPANTGLLLVNDGGKTEDVPVIASVPAVADNCLVGVNVATTIGEGDYILNVVSEGAGFFKAGTHTTLGAHKAYIPASVGNGVKGFAIDFDDDATGIDSLTPALSEGEGAIYNIAGQRLSKTQKGINIVNGKKVLK